MRSPSETTTANRVVTEASADSFEDDRRSALHPGRQPQPRAHGLPVAHLVVSERRTSAYYVMTSMDVWGRLADRSPLRILRWRPGLRVAVSVVPRKTVVLAPHDSGQAVLTRQGHIRLPVAVRRACRLEAGDRLLLVAYPDRGLLVAYTMTALDAMVLAYANLADEAPQ